MPSKARAAMINFGEEAKVRFDLEKFSNSAMMSFSIRTTRRVSGENGLEGALVLAYNEIVPTMRKDALRMMIVVSNGGNKSISTSNNIMSLIKAQNVTVFSIGIGNKINVPELQKISSSNVVITFDKFQDLEKQTFKVTDELCLNIETTTKRLPSTDDRVISTSSIHVDPFTERTSTTTESILMSSRKITTGNIQRTSLFNTDSSIHVDPFTERKYTTKESQPIPKVDINCINRPRDIIVVWDSSDSVSDEEFSSSKSAINNLLSYFPIMPSKARAAMIIFGEEAKVRFDLEKFSNSEMMSFSIRTTQRVSGENGLEGALILAYNEIVPTMRKDAQRMMIVVSNGGNKPHSTSNNIMSLIKSQNVTVFSIGIGNKINVPELLKISSANVVITFDKFKDLEKETFKVTDELCPNKETTSMKLPITTTDNGIISRPNIHVDPSTEIQTTIIEPDMSTEKITTRKIPRTSLSHTVGQTTAFEILKPELKCNGTKIDLMFAFDSSTSLNEDHWVQELNLATKVVNDLTIGKKYSQVGMLSFSDKNVMNIPLGSIMDKEDLKKEMMKQEKLEGSTYMAEALIKCKDELLEKGRSDVRKTIILLTDGDSKSPVLKVEEEAEKIKQMGIKIIIVGLGFSILKNQLINMSSSEMYYPIEDKDKISLFNTTALAKEACYIPKPVRHCNAQMDIIIILDTSSQVSSQVHIQQLLFAKKFIDLFDLAENLTRVSLVTFSDEAEVRLPFSSDYNVLFKTLQQTPYRGGLTRIDIALSAAKKLFYLRSERSMTRTLVVLLSNGLSKERTKSIGESYDLQELGVDVMTIAVSDRADREELELLASPGLHLNRADVKIEQTLIEDSVKKACNPTAKTEKKVCESRGDVIFVIDKSVDSSVVLWEGMKSTLLATMQSFNISHELTRVSIIVYSDKAKTEFRLDENFSTRDIYVAIKQLKQDGSGGRMSAALEQARQQFKVNNRQNFAKVLILLTDKLPENQKEALSQADDMKTDGVKIITVGLSKDAPKSFLEILSSDKNQITINDITKVTKHKEYLKTILCDALTNKRDQCTLKVLDVVVTMDSSSSVGPDNWKIQLDFINRLVANLDLRKGRTRLGLFTFATYVEQRIPINSSFTSEEMRKEIEKIPFVEGMTAIGLAIQDAKLHLLTRGRQNTPQVIVILTDGHNTKGISPQITAVEAKKAGIKIITVGIGGEISEKELKDISSSGNFYNVIDFQDLEKYNAKTITNDACQIPEKPKLCNGAGDLIFIMGSGAEKGSLRWNKMSDFMKTLSNLTVIGKDNTRVAVLKFNKGAYLDSGFKENYVQFEESIESMTSSVDGVFIGKALARARKLFGSDKRVNATKSVIIISDSIIKDKNNTLNEAELLKKSGINIFVIGVTQNISREELGQVASKEKALFVNDFQNLNNYNAYISAELCRVIKGTNKECSNKELEVMIAMDSSSSIGPINWQTQLVFVEKIIKEMDISQSMTRVGLVTFNTKAYKQFGLSAFSDKYGLISAIKKIEFSEGLTAIGDALRECKVELQNNSRRGAPQLIILITDGVAKGGIPPEDESILIKKYGIKIISIGIGDSISQSQLKFLSSTSNMYSILDYTSLKEYDSSFITRESCQVGKEL